MEAQAVELQQTAQAKQALEKKQEELIKELEPLKKQAAQMKEVQVEAQKAKALAERKDVSRAAPSIACACWQSMLTKSAC